MKDFYTFGRFCRLIFGGRAWNKESVPEDVLAWLYNLPDTKIILAWV
jgi:hypothetical protein